MSYNVSKRIIDVSISICILGLFLPIIIIVFCLLLVTNKGYPLFFQARPGKNEKIFHIIKFKTMNDSRDKSGNLLPDEKRLTGIGRIVRQLSIDELPQLINVLKGEMSLVGPRPLLIEYLQFYSVFEKRRHEVCPGITGWAQVNGRNNISWKKKFELDVYYVDNISFALDMKIFYLTIIKVLKSEGINKEGQATTEPFNGNN